MEHGRSSASLVTITGLLLALSQSVVMLPPVLSNVATVAPVCLRR